MDFVIGGLAGAGATIFTNPMDVVKTRLQLQGELQARHHHAPTYRNTFHAMIIIGKTDGLLALQKGLAPAMLMGFAMNSVRLGSYHIAEVQGWTKHKEGDISLYRAAFWAAVSGLLSGVGANPASVIKTRIQAASHPSIAVGRQHRYNGMLDAIVQIYKAEGIRGYFAGTGATCTRLFIGSASQLATFSIAKETLLNYGICEKTPFGLAFAASAVSGIVSCLISCPFDVINVRLYNQGPASGGKLLYNGVLDCLSKVYRTEGFHGLYKGLVPYYMRLAPHTTLSLVIWDMLNDILLSNKLKNS